MFLDKRFGHQRLSRAALQSEFKVQSESNFESQTIALMLKLNAVAFISPQNHPILIRTFAKQDENAIKYHFLAHTSLDVIEERVNAAGKSSDCYLGLLYAMEEVSVYGYITPLRVKIVLALALSDAHVKDVELNMIFKALHMAYYSAISNPFLKLESSSEGGEDSSRQLLQAVGGSKWKTFRRRVDEIYRVVGAGNATGS